MLWTRECKTRIVWETQWQLQKIQNHSFVPLQPRMPTTSSRIQIGVLVEGTSSNAVPYNGKDLQDDILWHSLDLQSRYSSNMKPCVVIYSFFWLRPHSLSSIMVSPASYCRLFSIGVLVLRSVFPIVFHARFFTFLSKTIRAVQRNCENLVVCRVWRKLSVSTLRFLRGSGCSESGR